MKVLIIGCGYIGIRLGAQLAQAGHNVTGIRRTHDADVELRSCGIVPVSLDISRPETLQELRAGYDWVIHCVSASGGGEAEYRRIYLEGTLNVIKSLAPTPPKKFIYTSSTSVYGQTDGELVDETSAVEPLAETARILVETERSLLKATQNGRLSAIILRVAGIYGPGRGFWLRQYLNGHARIEGDGRRWLNMVHRDDVAGVIAASLQQGTPGEIYNVADDQPITQLGLYQWLSAKTGRALPPAIPEPLPSERRRGLTNKRVSNQKLKDHLKYQFRYPTFKEGFAQELEQDINQPQDPS